MSAGRRLHHSEPGRVRVSFRPGGMTMFGFGARRGKASRWGLLGIGLAVAAAVLTPIGPGSTAQAALAAPQELLTNAGFESGTTGWGAGNYSIGMSLVPSITAKEGNTYLDVYGSRPGASLAQIVPVSSVPGESYRCSMWVRVTSDDPDTTADVSLALWGFGGTQAQQSSSTPLTIGRSWTPISVLLDVTRPHSYLKCELYLRRGSVEVDQASMMKDGLWNPGFEYSSGWTWGTGHPYFPKGYGSIGFGSAHRADALEGSSVGQVNSYDGSAIATVPVTTTVTAPTRCTMWVKADSPTASFTAQLFAIRRSTTGALLTFGYTTQVIGTSWTRMSAVAEATAGTSQVQCQLAPTSSTSLTTFTIDGASMVNTRLANPSLEGNASGWSTPNGPLTVAGPTPGMGALENSSYVTVTARAPWASLAQDVYAAPGSHRCTVSLRPGSSSTQVQLTIWDLTHGRSVDTKGSLSVGWHEYTAEIDLATTSAIRCELYLLSANAPVQVDGASFA